MTVDDGVRRLRLLDAKGRVWTQDMVLQVDDKRLRLLDPDTKVVLSQNQDRSRSWSWF